MESLARTNIHGTGDVRFILCLHKEDFHTAVSKKSFALWKTQGFTQGPFSATLKGCWFLTFRTLKSPESRIQSRLLPATFESNSKQKSCREGAAEGVSWQRGNVKSQERQKCFKAEYQSYKEAL